MENKVVKDLKTLVFVYGSLKKNYPNHYLLETSDKVSDFVTPPDYTMYSLGGFPAIVKGGDTPITGEVYSVDDKTFARLDVLEGYPHFYNREKINTDHGEAWIYFLEDHYGDKVVENGIW